LHFVQYNNQIMTLLKVRVHFYQSSKALLTRLSPLWLAVESIVHLGYHLYGQLLKALFTWAITSVVSC